MEFWKEMLTCRQVYLDSNENNLKKSKHSDIRRIVLRKLRNANQYAKLKN